jgi:hypothetical protein
VRSLESIVKKHSDLKLFISAREQFYRAQELRWQKSHLIPEVTLSLARLGSNTSLACMWGILEKPSQALLRTLSRPFRIIVTSDDLLEKNDVVIDSHEIDPSKFNKVTTKISPCSLEYSLDIALNLVR